MTMEAFDQLYIFFKIIVWEPKSHIVQKFRFFAPERYTSGFLHTDSPNSAGCETTI